MLLYDLGPVPWAHSQLIYHALGVLGREALCLLSPATPYVCIGFHQQAAQEIDLELCRELGIPVFKREVGGGAVYLDGNQIFFQLILRRDNPLVPLGRQAFYRKFLGPVIASYRRLGVDAAYKPINDIVCGARKISGTGVGEIGPCVVFVGNLIVDFDFRMMCRILKMPDEKFRDKVHRTMSENLGTLRGLLGREAADAFGPERLRGIMAQEFGRLLGPLQPAEPDARLLEAADKLGRRMLTDQWLHTRGRRLKGRDVKIRSGLHLLQRDHKAPGGLIRVGVDLEEGLTSDVSVSGDFFAYPKEALDAMEAALLGLPLAELPHAALDFAAKCGAEFPGVGPDDWKEAFSFK